MLRVAAFLAFVAVPLASAESVELASPGGDIRLRWSTDAENNLVYAVVMSGSERLAPARAGVIVDGTDLGAAVELGTPRTRRIDETFPWRGNKRSARNACVSAEIPVRSRTGGLGWTLEARVFDDGVAFRYRVPGTGVRRITGEATTWRLPVDATVWFQTDVVAYEGVYQSRRGEGMPLTEQVDGQSRPTHLGPPVTLEYRDGGYAVLTEANLAHYSGLAWRPEGGGRLRAAFPHDPAGWMHEGPLLSPWRVIVLSPDLNGLVNSDVIAALGEPPDPQLFPEGMNTPWIRPGKAPCTWMVFGNEGAEWRRQKDFVDQAAAMSCEYLLVDAGWRSERWGWGKEDEIWTRAAELCAYAAQRGVGIFLWHAFPDGREDSPGLATTAAREEFFARCQRAGVKGVKIDFFDSESKATVEACADLLRRAAERQLMVNLHGINKPTGEARTWPNEITREGIREQEYVLWGTLPLVHYGALPFTRLAAGHADFLPGYVQRRFLKNTTAAFQMAAVVVFSSPFLCWPDSPEAYLESPLLQFVRSVPVIWDETRILPGSKIGDTVIMARRHGSEWYVAALNCRAELRELELDLAQLAVTDAEVTVYRDGDDSGGLRIDDGRKFPASCRLAVTVRPGGGVVVHVKTPQQFGTWK